MLMLGWIANAILLVGIWQVGGRRRTAFLFTAVGEALWTVKAVHSGQFDLAFVCALFGLIALVNWTRWAKPCR